METIDVLIVEDDENIRLLYQDALTGADLKVHTAATATEGIEHALNHHPRVILMDIMLPDKSGHEAVAEIRKDDWGKKAKIIFLTNRTDAENIATAIEQGSEEYIIKAHTEIKDIINLVRLSMNT